MVTKPAEYKKAERSIDLYSHWTSAKPVGPDATECGAGQDLMGECMCWQLDNRVCVHGRIK